MAATNGRVFVSGGLGWGLLAALGYAAMNLSLRAAAAGVDPILGATLRAAPLCLMSWLLLLRDHDGRRGRLDRSTLARLVIIGLLFNITGNGSFQQALTWSGVSLTVPVSQSATLWGGALAGWWLMRERLSRPGLAGLGLLALAVVLLTVGAGSRQGPLLTAGLAAALAGLSYGGGNALLRHVVLGHGLTQGQALAPITTTGLLALAAIALARSGPMAALALEGDTLVWLLVAGLCNAVALGSLSRALSLLPVARVNALSTLQVGISAAGGVLLFTEPLTALLLLGLALSITGTLLAQTRPRVVDAA